MDKIERGAVLLEEVKNGMAAKSVVNNEAWQEAVKDLETLYINAIRRGSWLKIEGLIDVGRKSREENCRRLQVLDDLVTTLNNKIERGEQARKRLEANNADK